MYVQRRHFVYISCTSMIYLAEEKIPLLITVISRGINLEQIAFGPIFLYPFLFASH